MDKHLLLLPHLACSAEVVEILTDSSSSIPIYLYHWRMFLLISTNTTKVRDVPFHNHWKPGLTLNFHLKHKNWEQLQLFRVIKLKIFSTIRTFNQILKRENFVGVPDTSKRSTIFCMYFFWGDGGRGGTGDGYVKKDVSYFCFLLFFFQDQSTEGNSKILIFWTH